MLFTKSKIYIYCRLEKNFLSVVFVCLRFPYCALQAQNQKNIRYFVFFLCSAQYQTKTKFTKNQVGEFFFYKTLPLPFAWSSKGFFSPAGPTPMTKCRLFCPTRIFPFLRNAIPFQSMSNPADILYKKGKMVISVLWGIKKRSNRFWNLKAFLKKSKLYLGSSSDTTLQFF